MKTCSFAPCGRPFYAKGLCRRCYRRQVSGIPLDMPAPAPKGEPMNWLVAAVAIRTEECQMWPYATTDGYGSIRWEGRTRLAHHVALRLVGREVPPPPLEVRHLCGNGHLGCINPLHLMAGTRAENMADKVGHGTATRGERCGNAKLTAAQVVAIKSAPGLHREVAKQFGIARSNVSRIKSGKTWTHVTASDSGGAA